VLPALWVMLVVVASLYPIGEIGHTQRIPHSDKIVHFFLYFVLFLLIAAARNKRKSDVQPLFYGLLFCVFLGTVIEVLQEIMELGRRFSFFDILANISGTITGLTCYIFIEKKTLKSIVKNSIKLASKFKPYGN